MHAFENRKPKRRSDSLYGSDISTLAGIAPSNSGVTRTITRLGQVIVATINFNRGPRHECRAMKMLEFKLAGGSPVTACGEAPSRDSVKQELNTKEWPCFTGLCRFG